MRLQGTCPLFHESISWIISPFKFWTATIFLHAHLQVVYYKCVKFHKNPISCLGGVALTRYMDGWTDGQGDSYIPPQTLFAGGIIKAHGCYLSFYWIKNKIWNLCRGPHIQYLNKITNHLDLLFQRRRFWQVHPIRTIKLPMTTKFSAGSRLNKECFRGCHKHHSCKDWFQLANTF